MAIRGLYRNRFDAKTTELWNVQFNPSLPEPFSNRYQATAEQKLFLQIQPKE